MNRVRRGVYGDIEIPSACCYAVSTDKALSGWGMADGHKNRCIVPCSSPAEARSVMRYMRTRGDQKRVMFARTIPVQRRGVMWSVVEGWLDRARELDAVS
jgi:hypothetical protein